MNKLGLRTRINLGIEKTSGILLFRKQIDIDNVSLNDAGQHGQLTSGGHEERKGHYSHQGSKDYSVGVEGDNICAWPGTRGYPGVCH